MTPTHKSAILQGTHKSAILTKSSIFIWHLVTFQELSTKKSACYRINSFLLSNQIFSNSCAFNNYIIEEIVKANERQWGNLLFKYRYIGVFYIIICANRCVLYLICSGEPPDVAFVIAHAASFLVLKSAFPKISIRTGNMLASMTHYNSRNNQTELVLHPDL